MSADTAELVLRQDQGAVSHLSINRPESGNSLSVATIASLHEHLDRLREATDISVIVLSGVGRRIFSAGHDLKEFLEHDEAEFFKSVSVKCSAMMQAFRTQPQIIVAKVEGVASAAGCQLVAMSDLAVASKEARFATPGVNIGLWCLTPMVALSRTVLPKHAMQMLSTGKLFDAEHAFRIGLVNAIVESEELDGAVDALAGEISSKSGYTLALGKEAFYRQMTMNLSDAYEYSGELIVRSMAHGDAREGISAFVQKRPARWKGR